MIILHGPGYCGGKPQPYFFNLNDKGILSFYARYKNLLLAYTHHKNRSVLTIHPSGLSPLVDIFVWKHNMGILLGFHFVLLEYPHAHAVNT